MVTRVPVTAKVARWARERLSLSIAQAANLLKCDQEVLEQIENEGLKPTATLFRRMADVYLLPEATLLRATLPKDRPLPKDFRSFDGAPVKLKYKTIAALRQVENRQEELARLALVDEDVIAPNLPIHSTKENPDKLGEAFREQLGFPIVEQLRLTPEKAFMRWRLLIENMGISVYIEPFGDDDTRGASVFFNDFPAIVIDQNEKFPGAKLFTLFHELCHLLIRQPGISDFRAGNSVEAFCNRFASAFLMPVKAVQAVFDVEEIKKKEPGIGDLEHVAGRLCVTISQIALRLEQLGYVRGGYYEKIKSALHPPAPKKRPLARVPYKYVYLAETGQNFPETVFDSLTRQQITELDASRMLGLSPSNFKKVRTVLKTRRAEFVNEE